MNENRIKDKIFLMGGGAYSSVRGTVSVFNNQLISQIK